MPGHSAHAAPLPRAALRALGICLALLGSPLLTTSQKRLIHAYTQPLPAADAGPALVGGQKGGWSQQLMPLSLPLAHACTGWGDRGV